VIPVGQESTKRVLDNADAIGRGVEFVADALRSDDAADRLALYQIKLLKAQLAAAEAELCERKQVGLDGQDIAKRVARTMRAWNGVADPGATRMAAFLAHCIETVIHVSAGHIPRLGPTETAPAAPIDREHLAATWLVARAHGSTSTVLALFAYRYPEAAVVISRSALDGLVTAWTAAAEGGKWVALRDFWQKTMGQRVEPRSLKIELQQMRREYADRTLGKNAQK
jgi:hypothetical protein